jgi:hypothetical protein
VVGRAGHANGGRIADRAPTPLLAWVCVALSTSFRRDGHGRAGWRLLGAPKFQAVHPVRGGARGQPDRNDAQGCRCAESPPSFSRHVPEGRKPKADPMGKRNPGIPGPSACHEPFGS